MLRLKGNVAIVTGAANDLGEAVAQRLAREGSHDGAACRRRSYAFRAWAGSPAATAES